MKIEQEELLQEFYNNYDNKKIEFEKFKNACQGPWKYLKNEMENGELAEVRFKYFGTFQVYIGRAKMLLERLKNTVDNFSIQEQKRIGDMLNKYIDKNEENKS
jgi:hypothetical protein